MSLYRRAMLAGIASFALAGSLASAQTTIEDSAVQTPGKSVSEADIIVTATRREERLQNVPISITAVSGDTLFQRGVSDPERLTAVAPSLQISNGAAKGQASNFAIRGVGTTSFQRTIDSSVGIVIDDVALARVEMGVINFADIARVEVLNGPQGMLFGKNASAGLVHIHTNDPKLGESSGRIQSELNSLNTERDSMQFRTNGTMNLSLGAEAAARINVYYKKNEALFRNVVPNANADMGLEQIGGSAKLLWSPNDSFKVLVAADYLDSKGLNTGLSAYRSAPPGSPGGLLTLAAGIAPDSDNTKVAFDAPISEDTKVGGGQIKLEYELGGGNTLTNIAAVRYAEINTRFDADLTPAPLLDTFYEPKKFRQLSDELRIASPGGGRFDYQIGLYLLKARIRQGALILGNAGATPPPGFTRLVGNEVDQLQHLSSYAVFGEASYKLADSLRAIVGARLTHDKVDIQYDATTAGALLPVAVAPTSSPVVKRKETDLSWRGTLQYNIDDMRMLYATVARGYKGPGFAQFSTNYVRPETSHHIEAGLKSQFLDRHLTLNVAAYRTVFKDFQAQSVQLQGQLVSIFVQNAGKLETKGFDIQLLAEPVEGLSFTGGLAYADARFKSYTNDVCYQSQPAPDCVGGVTDSSGRRLPNAPKWTTSLNSRYERALGAGLSGSIGASLYSRSKVNFSTNGNPGTIQKGYTTVDVEAGIGSESGSWKLTVFCRNCTDKRFAGALGNNPLFPLDITQQYTYGSFRSLGAALDVRF